MDAGHLLGSASIKMSLTENDTKKTVISRKTLETLINRLSKIECFDGADYVLIESTYGDRFHGEAPDCVGELARNPPMKLLQEVEMLLFHHLQLHNTGEMLFFIRIIKEKGMVKSVPKL